MITLTFNEFPNYEEYPKTGFTKYTDEGIFDLEYDDYFVEVMITIQYDRYYNSQTYLQPKEDECNLFKLEVEILKAFKYDMNDIEIQITDNNELEKIKDYLTKNIEII